jgi:hypothetical protein
LQIWIFFFKPCVHVFFNLHMHTLNNYKFKINVDFVVAHVKKILNPYKIFLVIFKKVIKSWHQYVLGHQQVGDLWPCHVGSTCFLCSPLVFDIISFHKSYTLWTWFYHVSLWMKCTNHHDKLSSTQGVLICWSILW